MGQCVCRYAEAPDFTLPPDMKDMMDAYGKRYHHLKVGLYKFANPVDPRLKALGFNPCAYEVRRWFQSLCSFKFNLYYRYIEAPRQMNWKPTLGTVGLCTLNQVDP
jgi:hypothetical protein